MKPELDFPDEEGAKMEGVMEVIRTIRNLRAEMNVAAGKRTHLYASPGGWLERRRLRTPRQSILPASGRRKRNGDY